MEREIITTDKAPEAIGPYSQGVRMGDFLFTSGQIPIDRDGKVVGDDIMNQTRKVLENLKAILETGGSSLAQVIKTTVYLKDIKDFGDMNEVYKEYFKEEPPARTTVEVLGLPRDVKVEIEAIAIV